MRYVDDFVLIAENAEILNEYYARIKGYILQELKINIHPKKKLINKVENGIVFVGFFILPHRIILNDVTVKRIFRIVKTWKSSFNQYDKDILFGFFKTINSYFGMFINISGFNIRYSLGSILNSLFISPSLNFKKMVLY